MVSFWKLFAATLGERAIEPVIETGPGPFVVYSIPLFSTYDYFFGHPLTLDTFAHAHTNDADEVAAPSTQGNKLPLPSQAPGFRWSKDAAVRQKQKSQERGQASKRRQTERKLAGLADENLTYWATYLRRVSDQYFERMVGKPRESMIHLSQRKQGNEEAKRKETEKVCGKLAFLKAHPADVWLRWTRRQRPLRGIRRNYTDRMPARYLTERVDGELVTRRIMKATPLNRHALRGPYPVLSVEQKEDWDEMAEIEDGLDAWDTDDSSDSEDSDSSDELLDCVAFGPHSETAESGQEGHWELPAPVTACSLEVASETEPTVETVLKTYKPETVGLNAEADDGHARKRKRKREECDDHDDDSGTPVKKALRQRGSGYRAALLL